MVMAELRKLQNNFETHAAIIANQTVYLHLYWALGIITIILQMELDVILSKYCDDGDNGYNDDDDDDDNRDDYDYDDNEDDDGEDGDKKGRKAFELDFEIDQ